jgi:hypothetical protein
VLARTDSSILVVAEHTDLPVGAQIRLRPNVVAGDDTRVRKVEVSSRTPSPFGKAMGDHTVAWQLLVDAVHATVHGELLANAIEQLRIEHEARTEWMIRPGSQGLLLLRDLDDIAARRPRLEDAAFRASRHLQQAAQYQLDGNMAAATSSLGGAIACHLAFLNYLPFGTVPAKSARGSHGSAEGRHRAVLVGWEQERRAWRAEQERLAEKARTGTEAERLAEPERKRQAEEAAAIRRGAAAPELRKALWGLFDFRAAMREATVEYLLNPADAKTVLAESRELRAENTDMGVLARDLNQDTGSLTIEQLDRLQRIRKTVAGIEAASNYADIRLAAGRIKGAAESFIDGQSMAQKRSRLKRANDAAKDEKVAAALTGAEETAAALATLVTGAPARAARVLSAVLHKHMRYTARAYPDSVTDSKFLYPTPAEAALEQLWLAMEAEYSELMPAATDQITELAKAFTNGFGTLTGGIVVATGNSWVTAAGAEPLVTGWNAATRVLTINGRADAPPGVRGMGSHSTAWVVESMALRNTLRDTALDNEAVEALQSEAGDDFEREVIKLDRLLPADQLEGGQVVLCFEAAADVYRAADVATAARAHLRFRNLLPYATVDAGSRAGHGEREDATLAETYDRDSLDEAADLVKDALQDELQASRLAKALTAAAAELEAERLKDGASAWPEEVKKAAKDSVKRLSARSSAISKLALSTARNRVQDIADDAEWAKATISKARYAEHKRVYEIAHPLSPPRAFQGPAGAAGLVERVELGHLRIGQAEAEDLAVLGDPLLVRGLRNHNELMLNAPPKQHLGGCPAGVLGDALHRPCLQVPAGAERAVRLGRDAVLGTRVEQVTPVRHGTKLDLVHRWGDRASRYDVFQVGGAEVGHADRACIAQLAGPLHPRPGPGGAFGRPVHQVQVDLVDAEPAQALLGLGDRIAVPARIELGGDEYLVAGHAAVPQRPPDAFLVAVCLGGVDMPVAELERPADRVHARLAVRYLPDAEAEDGDLAPVGQDTCGCHVINTSFPSRCYGAEQCQYHPRPR